MVSGPPLLCEVASRADESNALYISAVVAKERSKACGRREGGGQALGQPSRLSSALPRSAEERWCASLACCYCCCCYCCYCHHTGIPHWDTTLGYHTGSLVGVEAGHAVAPHAHLLDASWTRHAAVSRSRPATRRKQTLTYVPSSAASLRAKKGGSPSPHPTGEGVWLRHSLSTSSRGMSW